MTKKTKLYKLLKNRIQNFQKISKTQNLPPKSQKISIYKKNKLNKLNCTRSLKIT